MWGGLMGRYRNEGLTWLVEVEGLGKGTNEWCTDGYYHRGKAPNISGARWMCCSTAPVQPGGTRKVLKDNF